MEDMINKVAVDVTAAPEKHKSWIADILPGITKKAKGDEVDPGSEAGLLRYLHNYADSVAKQAKDFKHSAAIREIIENPDKDAKAYTTLLNAARFHILANALQDIGNHILTGANGLLLAAMKKIPSYEPMIYVNDNPYGQFVMDSLEDLHLHFEASAPFKKQNFTQKEVKKGAIIIGED